MSIIIMLAIILLYEMILILYNTPLIISEASELRVNRMNGFHACPGRILTFECIVNGTLAGSTVWRGTAFSDCEIILLHNRFGDEEGTTRTCSNSDITGRSVRIEGNHYISQLEITIDPETVGKSVVCAHDDGRRSYTIGSYQISAVSSWPLRIQVDAQSTATLANSQISFGWEPAISDCPTADIRYYILSANCGTCPIVTADTSITCNDVPLCGFCILAVQTVIGDYAVNDLLSDPAYVSLNQTRNCIQIGSNNTELNTGFAQFPPIESDVNNGRIISFTIFVASIASTAVIAAALTLCIIMIIMALRFTVKKKARSLKSLQRADAEKHQAAEERLYEATEPTAIAHLKLDCVTVENTVYA